MSSENDFRSYPAPGITVTWDASRCRHATECVRGLPLVFDPTRRPWITPEAAAVDDVIDVVDRCPSYALGYRTNDGRQRTAPEVVDNTAMSRFEIRLGGTLAGFAEYQRANDLVVFSHTEIREGLKGKGLATHLITESLDMVRAQDLRVLPLCPFVIAFMAAHPEFAELDYRHH